MARTEDEDKLRGCPMCGTKVGQADLGLHDYSSWLADYLPGRVSGSDVDCVIEQSKTGRMLFLEFKRKGQLLPVGQRLLLKACVKRGIDVWVCWESATHVEVGPMDVTGEVLLVDEMTHKQLGLRIKRWWNAGLEGA